ncbi:DUF4132 domain-containing protein [Phormidesmis priestleyi ULC007]|uniref:DUF4132 domain-containing protein n=1 Tax=Phormidesmis priestleyi ULC007 TaxID=1920490 RepID=A0A2T1DM67_9CYAN|nr:DUF4132 domain-containing protein [Phormidesmis priestleyi]PSB21590.1 DUF4132 domain-containing protein [Phormidesmis priestleyi ULC007]PZO54631.1 MAG: DUF4132 domain-containing protein [Phormidesmis priestleyi]
MLNPEVAQAQLKQVYDKNWRSQRLQQIAALPEPSRTIAYALIGHRADGLSSTEIYQYRDTALQQLDRVDDPTPIFDCLFPQFGTIVTAAWNLHTQLPYQSGYSRRSFRAPHHPQFQQNRRNWLLILIEAAEGYDQDLTWFAAWVPYLRRGIDSFGILFAAAINQGDELGQTIFQILLDSAQGDHEIGVMGRHITRGLLVANRPEGWEFVERLLLAAQRQEGLRQTILETIDEAHPIAFERMLRLIVAENLTRFSAVVRAIDVWFGFGLESLNEKLAKQILIQVSELLGDETAQQSALESSDPQTVYLALWSLGFRDAIAAIETAVPLLQHCEPTHRFVVVHFLTQLSITPARLALIDAIDDPDLQVATHAVQTFQYCADEVLKTSEVFEHLEKNLPRFPEKPKTSAIVWEWMRLESSQGLVATALVHHLGTRSPKRLIPFLSVMDAYKRQEVAQLLAAVQPWDAEIRDTLFKLVGDAKQWVRQEVIRLLHQCTITTDESTQIEQLMTRKASDLRRGILGLLLNQSDKSAIASAKRLLQAKQAPQRQAGLELLRELVLSQRTVESCRTLAIEYQARQSKQTTTEEQWLATILEPETKEVTLTDALGLINVAELTPIATPEPTAHVTFNTPASMACLIALDELIHEHRQTPVKFPAWEGEQEDLLGNLNSEFPSVDLRLSQSENRANLPLSDVWENWWQQRTSRLRDEDGLELFRAIAPAFGKREQNDEFAVENQISLQSLTTTLENLVTLPEQSLRYPSLVNSVIRWLIYQHPPEQASEFILNAIAHILQLIPAETLSTNPEWLNNHYWGVRSCANNFLASWIRYAYSYEFLIPEDQQQDYRVRWWQLNRWLDRWIPSYYSVTTVWDVHAAYQAGAAKEADLIFHLVGAPERDLTAQPELTPGTLAEAKATLRTHFSELAELTRRKPHSYEALPYLREIADRIRQRILAVELQRGNFPTAASSAACSLRSLTGISTIVQLIQALGQEKLVRGYSYNNLSKATVFSHLMRVSFPAPEDTPEEFKQRVMSAQIADEKLIQFAFYAPQWVNYVEHSLSWVGLADAVWWIHAHTKDTSWSVEQDVRETWEAQISERTPLSTRSLMDGAVDVAWFLSIRKRLKKEHWQQIYEMAQFASSGGGHQRAKLFADAMLGNLESGEVRDRILKKRHQDAVRALGLLPLPKGKKREKELLDRYQLLQEFLRSSKKFGSQRQASEKLAVEIGLENLARTAGFIDPQRLQWAMEAAAVADLAGQAQTIAIDTVSISLSINALGEPEIAVSKAGKPLKSIPIKLKKDPQIQVLTSRKQDITKQASRMRISLEQAMCRGDRFAVNELIQLRNHPVLAPMLNQLILVDDRDIGYLEQTGLRHHDETIRAIQSDTLRIAHPYDLLQSNEWHLWQQDCFNQSRAQPFKQVFRELYVPTAAEQSEQISHRYEGHQVNPRQAIALFGQRGWITSPDQGVRRTFHTEGLIAEVDFLNGFYTPLEVEGLTIADVRFYRRDEWKPLPLNEVPSALFSEVMRDLDLVVSVAHQGGVDPEATASTVEMRSTLVRETCRLLKLSNVQIQSKHVLIEGHLGSYSIHLGSAIVHRQPGGALCIIPVASQHRGRIFLPFVDNDPKTAEVISKVVLLSKDKEIQDPTILEQIL